VFEEFQIPPVKKEISHASPLTSYNMDPVEPLLPAGPVHDDHVGKDCVPRCLTPARAGVHKGSNPAIGKLASIGEGLDQLDSSKACAEAIKKIEPELEGLVNFGKIKTDVKTWIGQLAREPWDATTKKLVLKRIKNWVEKLE